MSGHVIPRGAFVRGAAAAPGVPASGGLAARWLRSVLRMARAIEERRILATLDDRMLSDIGANRLEAEREIERLPWDTAPRG